MKMLLQISSLQSSSFYDANSPWDFTVDLPTPIPLDTKKWKIGLTDIKLMRYENQKTWETGEDLYVFTDVAEHETFVFGSFHPLLAIVDENGKIDTPHFISVSREFIHRVRIYIRDRHMKFPSIKVDFLRCSLHLKPSSK